VAVAVELALMLRTDPSLARAGDGDPRNQPMVRLIGALGALLDGEARAEVEGKYGLVRPQVRKDRESVVTPAPTQEPLGETPPAPEAESEAPEAKPQTTTGDEAP
jgi:hypothetical protein